MQLPSRIDWRLLFQVAKRHGITKIMIARETKVGSEVTLGRWGDNTYQPTQPGYDRAAIVINYLGKRLPEEDIERCVVYRHD